MTALAGVWNFAERSDLSPCVELLLKAQRSYASGRGDVAHIGRLSLGRVFRPILTEDAHDRGIIRDISRGLAMAADVRIDNRPDLLLSLHLPRDYPVSDAGLFFMAFVAWGEAAFDRIIGDYAAAIWSDSRQSLTLVRDPFGQRPLHYHVGDGFAAFASMPQGLRALPQIGDAIDLVHIARFVADVPRTGASSAFRHIKRVLPGHIVTIDPRGERSRACWQRPRREIRLADDRDYEEALRSLLDQAVASRIRGGGPIVAAHLSGGLDSGAVAATAARLRGNDPVLALTSVPRAGFSGPSASGRIGDESASAAAIAALYPNMRHRLVRRGDATPLDRLSADSLLFQEPVGHPCNHVWWSLAGRAAQQAGARVLLTGEAGNLSLSAGGVSLLADLVRTGAWRRWFSEARGLTDRGTMRWRGVLFTSFAPWLPKPLWRRLNRFIAGHSGESEGHKLLAPAFRAEIDDLVREQARGGRPEGDNGAFRYRLLTQLDPGNYRKGALARWGLDERDPTTDRRLVEFALSLPVDQLLRDGENRRLARHALADRLPPSVLHETRRGYQAADWYEGLTRETLFAESAVLGRSPAASALLDLDRVDRLIHAWPENGWADGAVLSAYRIGLLRALSGARFAAALEAEAAAGS